MSGCWAGGQGWPDNGAGWKVRGSPQLLQFSLRRDGSVCQSHGLSIKKIAEIFVPKKQKIYCHFFVLCMYPSRWPHYEQWTAMQGTQGADGGFKTSQLRIQRELVTKPASLTTSSPKTEVQRYQHHQRENKGYIFYRWISSFKSHEMCKRCALQ